MTLSFKESKCSSNIDSVAEDAFAFPIETKMVSLASLSFTLERGRLSPSHAESMKTKRNKTAVESCLRVDKKSIMNVTANFANDVTKFGKTSLFSSKFYKAHIRLDERKGISHLITSILDKGKGPTLLRKKILPSSLFPEMKTFHTAVWSARTSHFLMALLVCASIWEGSSFTFYLELLPPSWQVWYSARSSPSNI